MSSTIRPELAIGLLLFSVACSGGGGSSAVAPSSNTSSVSVSQRSAIPSDGVAGAAIQITLRDATGAPLGSRTIRVTATGSDNTFLPAEAVRSGINGQAEVRLVSTRAERKRIRVDAESGGTTTTIATDIEVEFQPPSVPRRRVSVASSGAEANDFSGHAAVSGNGRYVAFMSKADNLVAGDSNEKEDVFVHDRESRTTARVSLTPSGGQFPDLCGKPSLSDDGTLVAFMGRLRDTDAIWVRDRLTNRTEPISDTTSLRGRCFDPAISGDGRFVAFINNNGEQQQVWVFDRNTGAVSLASRNDAGQPGNNPSYAPSISRNGRWVAFASSADNLVASDSNEKIDVFVHDRQNGTTRLVSRNANGTPGNDDSIEAHIAADAGSVTFSSKAANLVPNDDNGKSDVFVVELATRAIQRVSVDTRGREVDKESWLPRLSADGLFVVFSSLADDLVADDRNGKEDVFVRDLATGVIRRVSLALGSADANECCTAPSLAADAPVVAFTSMAQNLTQRDENDQPDVFVAPRN